MLKKCLIIVFSTLTLTSYATSRPVVVKYDGKIEIKDIHQGQSYVLNRKYTFTDIPNYLLFSQVTILNGNARKTIVAKIPANAYVYIALDSGRKMKKSEANEVKKYVKILNRQGWRSFGRIKTSDKRMEYLQVLRKRFYSDTTEKLLGVGFPGVMIIAKSIELEKSEK